MTQKRDDVMPYAPSADGTSVEPPTYRRAFDVRISAGDDAYCAEYAEVQVCSACGALVIWETAETHTTWHRALRTGI